MTRVVTPPIIRSTYNCNHSIWNWSNRLCYLPLSWSSCSYRMRLYTVYYISLHCSLYVFRVVIPPIIRSTYNCNHSIWNWSNRLCYLPLSWSSCIIKNVYWSLCKPHVILVSLALIFSTDFRKILKYKI
jgi:hypothetical protein